MNIECSLRKVKRGVGLDAVRGCLAALPEDTPLHVSVLDALAENVRGMRQNLLLAGYAARTGVQVTSDDQPVYALVPEQMREYVEWTTAVHDKLAGEPDKGVDTDTWVEPRVTKAVCDVWRLAMNDRDKKTVLWMTNKLVLPPDWLEGAELYLVHCNLLDVKGS